MSVSNFEGVVGNQPINPWGLPDDTRRHRTGVILTGADPYWAGGQWIYTYASAGIRQYGLVTISATKQTGGMRIEATEVANTANLGRTLGVAMTAATTGQYIWVQVYGTVPVNSNASVAADTALGIAAAGQAGAISAGKQILNARVSIAATNTVVIAATANSGSTVLTVPNADGWFIGAYLSGTGIAASTVVTQIDPSGTQVTINNATTAAVNGNVTATYNNGTVFYNVVSLNSPFAQGQIS